MSPRRSARSGGAALDRPTLLFATALLAALALPAGPPLAGNGGGREGLAAQSPAGSAEQEPPGAGEAGTGARAAVLGDTVTVGDVVPVAVRVILPPGTHALWPDTLPLAGTDLDNAATVRERIDTLADGRLQVTALYSVTPWRPGELALPDLAYGVRRGDERVDSARVRLPPLEVASVLPTDTAGIEPRPARGVIGPNWPLWPFLLGLLLLLALIAAAVLWWRRRRRAAALAPAAPVVPPRERALAALREARERGLLEQGEVKAFYTLVAAAVREYMAALDRRWSEDLTTSELLTRLAGDRRASDAARLGDVLRGADQVKFARRRPDGRTALEEWELAVAWVEGFDAAATRDAVGEAA